MSTPANDLFKRDVRAADRSQSAADLSAFFTKVYGWMAFGLAMTGCVALSIAHSETATSLLWGNRGLVWGIMLGQLALVFAFATLANRVSGTVASLLFTIYAASVGVTMSSIFLVYTQQSISQMFFVTAGAFGGLSFVGATTKRDLSAMGRFMTMGLWGLILALVVNWWLQSPALQFVASCAGVLIFSGLTAWDTQKLKTIYSQRGESGNLALYGALTLYLDFINLFLFLLRLFGTRRN